VGSTGKYSCGAAGWSQFIGLQMEYNLIERTVERERVATAKALNLGVPAWSPLSNGVLTGKYHREGKSGGAGCPMKE
jgi:aryl-alcohol dehydrogenase-like predicted oxidoreductase